MSVERIAAEEIAALRAAGLFRERRPVVDGAPGPTVRLGDGRTLRLFCGNDYLGLAGHPTVRAAAVEAIARFGTGAGASRLVSGDLAIHRQLEERLAAFCRRPAATVFPTGFQTNLGAVGALVGRGDLVCSDARNHASLVDACRLSRAEVRVYPHADGGALGAILAREGAGFRRRLVVTDAVFSMTGAVAPLPDLARTCEQHDAVLLVDEAHAVGVLGPTGRGIAEHFGLPPDAVPVSVVTFGKALGGQGGAVVGSAPLADLIRNRARAYVFTTGLAPASAAAVDAALRVVAEEPGRVTALRARGAELRAALRAAGIRPGEGVTPIVPVILGDPRRTVAVAAAMERRGLLVGPIRPPTVPEGEAGLRLTVHVDHTPADLAAVAEGLAEALAETQDRRMDTDPGGNRVTPAAGRLQ